MTGRTVSHYRIIEKLGGGGMGVVYKAEDLKLHRTVALKFLPPELTRDEEAKKRFILEAEAASSMDHNNICVIHEVDEADGQLFICMNYYEGETLKGKISSGSIKTEEAINIAIQIAEGLRSAHEKGIIHRDIKPANIFISSNGIVKILDFGLAKLIGNSALTRMGETLGTTGYMSPEQARGDSIDHRTDIWSLGVLLYEMITGKLPFRGEYDNAVLYNILNQEPEPPRDVRKDIPPGLNGIILKCLQKDPDERYRDPGEIITDLRSFTELRKKDSISNRKKTIWYGVPAILVMIALIIYFILPVPDNKVQDLKMIAVLPFENLGPAEDEYFADGLTEEITSRLAGVSNLGVISRTSTIQYRKSSKSLPIIAKELGVEYILEGTVRWVKSGEHGRIRITPQLIKVSEDVHLWADNMDKTFEDIFDMQTEIATQVVKSLNIVLNESERRGIGKIPTKNMEAYQVYLQSYSRSIYDREGLDKIIELCEQAVRLDSTFADAFLRLSWAHLRYYWFGHERTKERLSIAKQNLDRTFTLRPDLPEAKFVLGYYYYYAIYDYNRALEAFAEAEKVLPNNANILLATAYILRRQGKFEQALDKQKKGFVLDPKNPNTLYEIGNTLTWLGRFSEAEEYYDRYNILKPNQSLGLSRKADLKLLQGDITKSRKDIEQMPEKNKPWIKLAILDLYERKYQSALKKTDLATGSDLGDLYSFIPPAQMKGVIYWLMKDTLHSQACFDSAMIFLQNEIKKNPDDERLHSSLGIVYAGLGRTDAAVREAELAAEMLPLSQDAIRGMFILINLAQVYSMVGRYDSALDILELLLSPGRGKNITPHILKLDPLYDPLRSYPRFQALLAKNNQNPVRIHDK